MEMISAPMQPDKNSPRRSTKEDLRKDFSFIIRPTLVTLVSFVVNGFSDERS